MSVFFPLVREKHIVRFSWLGFSAKNICKIFEHIYAI